MGWFRGREPDDGLYRGDAPAYAPGSGDDAPRAYVSGVSGGPRPIPHVDAPPSGPAQPPGPWGAPTGTGPHHAYPAPVSTRRRGPGAGCGVVAILVILGVVGVIVFGVFRSVQSAFPDRDVPATRTGTIDAPVTVEYNDAELRLTVSGAQAQPGDAWDRESGEPTLLVAISVERLDDGSATVHVPFLDWEFTPSGGADPAGVDIVSGFEPDLTSITLNAGDRVSGYLAFTTGGTAGRLQLDGDRFDDPPLVMWDLVATPAAVISGSVGLPVRPQIGMPPFTVTLNSTVWADQAQAGSWQPPANGAFLVADMTITSTGGEFSAWVEDSSFVFVPAGGTATPVAPPSTASSAQSIATVSAGGSAPLRAVFDTPVAAGVLEMRDAAGRTMVAWPIA